jgi:ferritin-like metal-binding protein YciE
MAKKEPKNLEDLFLDGVKDIYFAEKKILIALPKMAKAAQSEDAKEVFKIHEAQTEKHVERLERVFEILDEKAAGKKCPAIMGLIEEGEEIIEEYKDAPSIDAGLIAAAQSVEHYEISRYGTLKNWAKELGLSEAVDLLDQTLAEEKTTDETLTKLAESAANQKAEAA